MSTETTNKDQRFRQLRSTLPVILALVDGGRLDAEGVSRLAGVDLQQAGRLLRVLVAGMQLATEREGHRVVAFRPAQADLREVDLMGMVALTLASAGMEQFRDSQIHAHWRQVAARAVERSSARARRLHEVLDRAVYFVRGPHMDMRRIQGTVDEILSALAHGNVLTFSYKSANATEPKPRRVEPWTLAIHSGQFYLLGPEEGHERVKAWRLEAVADCRRDRNSSFEYPNRYRHQPDRHFEDSFGIWQDHREPEEVEIRVTGELRDYVAGTVWHQSEHKTLEVGAVRVRFRLAINPEVERWLLSLGKHVEILKPDDLRAAIAEHHREAAARAGHT